MGVFLGNVIFAVVPVVVEPFQHLEIVLAAVDEHTLPDALIHAQRIVVELLGLVGDPLPALVIVLERLTGLADVAFNDLGQIDAAVAGDAVFIVFKLFIREIVEGLNQFLVLRDFLVLLLFELLERVGARHAVVEFGRLSAGIGQVKDVLLLLAI